MNKFFKVAVILFIGLLSTNLSYSQGIYFLPDPTNVTEPARLYINTASSDCQCDELLDASPANPIFLWTWMPVEARAPLNIGGSSVDITNGEWGNSNDNMMMTQDENNPALWYYDFFDVPLSEFYGADPADFYTSGIEFLIKEKSGAAIGGEGPEQKSADLSIVPESPGCVLKLCTFPTIWYQSDYLTLTLDNSQEANPSLQDLNEGEALVWFRYKVNDGAYQVSQSETEGIMDYLGNGFFSFTLIPEVYFGLEENDVLDEIQVYFTKTPIVAPPFSSPISLFPGCPE